MKNYYSYLLRLWKAESQENGVWRVMLEDPHTHEVVGFEGLEALFDFLMHIEFDEPADQDEVDRSAGE